MSKFLTKIYLPFGVVTSLALLLSYLAGAIDPRSMWSAAYLSLVFPYLYLFGILVAFIGLLIKNHKAWILVLLLIILSTLFRKSFFNITINSSDSSGLSILSHNIGSSISGTQPAKWAFYHQANVDIYCFQEWVNSASSIRYIKDSLIRQYHSTLNIDPNFWPIFSKYPILHQGEINSTAIGNGATWADILYQNDTIRVYNVHLVSNRISGQTEDLMKSTSNIRRANTWQRIKGVLRRYKNALLQRTLQAEVLKKHITSCKYPVILAGDFNDIPSSFVYRLLQKNMRDAWYEAGNGMAYTYAGKLPFLHIDHILTKGNIKALDLEVLRVNYSDHYPVLARLKVGN